MNVIRREKACIKQNQNIEKNANLPQGLDSKHLKHGDDDKKQSLHNKFTNGNAAAHDDDSNSCHQSNFDPSPFKPPLLDIPSPDVIQKRLLQLSAAFSRTQLSTLFDFSCLNNVIGRHNNSSRRSVVVGHDRLFSTTTYSASSAASRLSVHSETNSNQSSF
jgi:hypothetical protein